MKYVYIFCAIVPLLLSGCITPQQLEQRETYTKAEINRLQDHNLTLENRFEEMSTMLIKLSQDFDTTRNKLQTELAQLENQINTNVNSRLDSFATELDKNEDKLNGKLKVILDEVLKENQRIIQRTRMIEKEVYGQASQSEIITKKTTSGDSYSSDTEYVTHVVKTGENLWSISMNYGVTMESIAEANRMESISDIIRPGEVLQIPVRTDQ